MEKLIGSREERLALGTFVKLLRAAESVSADVHKEILGAGLTISQFGILEALYHLGAMNQKEVGRKILKSAGNITMVIDNLEKRKLVKRKKRSDDRRSFEVHLTETGEALLAELFPLHKERISKRLSILSSDEQKRLSDLLRKLGHGQSLT